MDHDAAVAVPVDASPDAPPSHDHATPDPTLEALQQQLGSAAVTCAGTAKLLANQGTAPPAVVRRREAMVRQLCERDRWPAEVRECVASATHDQLACTAYLATPRQKQRWNAAFEKWLDGTEP